MQSVVVDPQGHLWVLDPAAPAMGNIVEKGPKLVEIDLDKNAAVRTIAFDEIVAPQGSYLNDVRFSPDGKMAYLTDSGAKGALIVLDIASGKARGVLDGDVSTMPDKSVTVMYDGKPLRRPDGRGVEFSADGIALSPDGKQLYWQAIKGKTLYAIATDQRQSGIASTLLTSETYGKTIAGKVRAIGENGPADGLWIGHDGHLYVSSPQDNAVKMRDLSNETQSGTLQTIVQDERLRWPDTFSEGSDGSIYMTTSHIQDSAFFKPDAPIALPTQLWRFTPPGAAARANP